MADANSYASTRGYDICDAEDALSIARALAMAVSTVEQLAPSWKPEKGQTLSLSIPQLEQDARPGRRSIKVLDKPKMLPFYQHSLWGRRTLCWSATAAEMDTEGKQGEPFPLILKCAWLPEYLDTHEHQMLSHLDRDVTPEKVRSFPVTLGYLDWEASQLRPPPATGRLPKDPPGQSVLDNSSQACLYVLAEKCVRGEPVYDQLAGLTLRDLMRIYRDLLRLLRRVSARGIHYRDINLGNFALKPGWRTLPEEESCLVLYDFGNSRYLNQPRGGDRSPKARNLALGADDAQSCNSMFASHRMLGRSRKSLILKEAERSLARARSEAERKHFLNEVRYAKASLVRSDHRFIDDGESATWATLYLLHDWFGRRRPQQLAEFKRVMNVPSEKETLWANPENWHDFFGAFDFQVATVMRGIGKAIGECQKDITVLNLPQEMTEKEDNAHSECDELLMDYVHSEDSED